MNIICPLELTPFQFYCHGPGNLELNWPSSTACCPTLLQGKLPLQAYTDNKHCGSEKYLILCPPSNERFAEDRSSMLCRCLQCQHTG